MYEAALDADRREVGGRTLARAVQPGERVAFAGW
jgi:hypothetical protein